MPKPTLQAGDILFRWVYTDAEKAETLQQLIGDVQSRAIEAMKDAGNIDPDNQEEAEWRRLAIPSMHFAREIEHVGIFVGSGQVVEVGAGAVGGLSNKSVADRPHYDVVVRFEDPQVGMAIAETSKACNLHGKTYSYPFHKLFTEEEASIVVASQTTGQGRWYEKGVRSVAHGMFMRKLRHKAGMRNPSRRRGPGQWVWGPGQYAGGWGVMQRTPVNPVLSRGRNAAAITSRAGWQAFLAHWPILKREEERVLRAIGRTGDETERYKVGAGRNEPVCSHFVYAVLYAVICGGSVHVATLYKTEHIFNVTPNMLWHYFLTNQGIFRNQRVRMVGVQHEGEFTVIPTLNLVALLENANDYPSNLRDRHIDGLGLTQGSGDWSYGARGRGAVHPRGE